MTNKTVSSVPSCPCSHRTVNRNGCSGAKVCEFCPRRRFCRCFTSNLSFPRAPTSPAHSSRAPSLRLEARDAKSSVTSTRRMDLLTAYFNDDDDDVPACLTPYEPMQRGRVAVSRRMRVHQKESEYPINPVSFLTLEAPPGKLSSTALQPLGGVARQVPVHGFAVFERALSWQVELTAYIFLEGGTCAPALSASSQAASAASIYKFLPNDETSRQGSRQPARCRAVNNQSKQPEFAAVGL
jgi:hypothetical protein